MHHVEPVKPSLLVAALVAPLFTPLFAIFSLAFFPSSFTDDGYYWIAFPFVLVLSVAIGYAGMLLVCLPVVGLLRLLGRLNAPAVCGLSSVLGASAWTLLLFRADEYPAHSFAVGLICSFGVTALFCWIGGITRSTGSQGNAPGFPQQTRRILRAGTGYFLTVFAAGFALAFIRLPFLVPRFGERTAELMEMPVMLAVIAWAAWRLAKRYPDLKRRSRLLAGLFALMLLVAAELLVAWFLGPGSPGEYIASRDPVSGSVYLASLGIFAVAPALGSHNVPLMLAGLASFLASAFHLVCIAGGAEWYLRMGAGEAMASMAAQGHWYPTVVTMAIAAVLAIWGLYAWSGAGLIRRLPLLRTCLAAIAAVFLVRGVAFVPLQVYFPGNSATFWYVSSAICVGIGLLYALGLFRSWTRLSRQLA